MALGNNAVHRNDTTVSMLDLVKTGSREDRGESNQKGGSYRSYDKRRWKIDLQKSWRDEKSERMREVVSVKATGLTRDSDRTLRSEGTDGECEIPIWTARYATTWETQQERWQKEQER